jgi:hypothetical protein
LDYDYLPLWLQNEGYWTGFVGKFLVEYSIKNYKTVPLGWDEFDGLVFPWNFRYYNPVFSRNGQFPRLCELINFEPRCSYCLDPLHYSTDVVADKTLGMIEEGHASGKPFFVFTCPVQEDCLIQ